SQSRLLTHPGNAAAADRALSVVAGEEPELGTGRLPIGAKQIQEAGRQHDITVLVALALLDADHHPVTVNISNMEVGDFRDAQPPGVRGHQHSALSQTRNRGKEPLHFFHTEDDRQLLFAMWKRN